MKTIVAAVDFSDSTPGVVSAASKQAAAFGAGLHLVHVLEPEPSYTAYGFTPDEFPAMHVFQQEARKRAQTKLDGLAAEWGAEATLLEGSALYALTDFVKQSEADLVVLGCHGHGVVAALLLGSVAEGMVRKALVPTMIIPVVEK